MLRVTSVAAGTREATVITDVVVAGAEVVGFDGRSQENPAAKRRARKIIEKRNGFAR
jgi:hypothetical protein